MKPLIKFGRHDENRIARSFGPARSLSVSENLDTER